MTEKIVLRAVNTIEEVESFQKLEQLIWQSPPEDTVPVHVAITVIRNGGGLIAAFDDNGPAEEQQVLIIGGDFDSAGGITANNIVQWGRVDITQDIEADVYKRQAQLWSSWSLP